MTNEEQEILRDVIKRLEEYFNMQVFVLMHEGDSAIAMGLGCPACINIALAKYLEKHSDNNIHTNPHKNVSVN